MVLLIDHGKCRLRMGQFKRAEELLVRAADMASRLELKHAEIAALSSLAEVFLNREEVERAFKISQKAIRLLSRHTVLDPEGVWFIHYKVAQAANKMAVAQRALQHAYSIVQQKAQAILDSRLRQTFLVKVAINRAIIEAKEKS